MAMTAAAHEPEVGPDAALLEAVRAQTRLATEVEIRRLELIVEWCATHRVAEAEAATYVEFGRDTGLALAGPGAPWVSEFAVLELAAALGMTRRRASGTSGRCSRSTTASAASGHA
jgi:hypothetical protein